MRWPSAGLPVASLALWVMLAVGCASSPAPMPGLIAEHGGHVIEDWPAYGRAADGRPSALPPGFRDEVVIDGLNRPTALAFLPTGDALVAEQRGTVTRFFGPEFTDRAMLLDLRTEVFNRGQQGLLGLAVDPDFEFAPFVYVAYTRDAMPGGTTPTYGRPATDTDECAGGRAACPASGRLARFRVGTSLGEEQVLIDDWCITGPNHSVGDIAFDRSGALLAGGGDGADGDDLDLGQLTVPANVCGDPPTDAGQPSESSTSEGGALRSQDLQTPSDPAGLDGTIVRVDRATGQPLPDNPLADAPDPNAQRIIAYGLRNPFRFTLRPGTDEIWLADVGWDSYEEVDRIADPLSGKPANLGWPCFEGPYRQPAFDALDNRLCEALYASEPPELLFPFLSVARPRRQQGACESDSAAISALAFYDGTAFPADYAGALFFGDPLRRCLWTMRAGDDGLPDPTTIAEFLAGASPVDLLVGPEGALYYVDVFGSQVRRIAYSGS